MGLPLAGRCWRIPDPARLPPAAAAPAMPDLDETTLFGERQQDEAVPWPHGYGGRPTGLIDKTLLGQIASWHIKPWPEGYGGQP